MFKHKIIFLLLIQAIQITLVVVPSTTFAQFYGTESVIDVENEDLKIGGDIFSNFNEDIDATQVLEDERFYHYGRFYSLNLAIGVTTFDGNRGRAYEDELSYGLSVNYFLDFETSFVLGVEYSQHHFFLDYPVNAYRNNTEGHTDEGAGLVKVGMLRAFFGYRYYIDTSNLGTAITYSNPYFTTRLEYWYVTNTFMDTDYPKDNGGDLGFGIGGGLEFPVKLKQSYIGVEALVHISNFHDKDTGNYRPVGDNQYNNFGYDDLSGYGYSVLVSYIMNW